MSKIPIFDIGDTLMPCKRLQNSLLKEKFELEGEEFPEFDVNKFRVYNPEEVQDYFEKYGIQEAKPKIIVEEYKRREKRFLERNNVFEVLKRCSAKFGKIGFISDNSLKGKEWFENLLDQNNVPYEGFVVSEEVGVEKPDPDIFKEFLDRREEAADRFVYIGNNVSRDEAAKNVGMGFIWLKKYETFGGSYEGRNINDLSFEKIKQAINGMEAIENEHTCR